MEGRSAIAHLALLCAKSRVVARGCKLAVALAPTYCAAGCHDSEHDEVAAAEGLIELDQRLVVSNVAISTAKIRFDAGERSIELALIPNARLLAPNAVIVRDGIAMSAEQARVELPYRGHVVGDPNSWIRVSVADGKFEGLIYMDESLWDAREVETGEIVLAPAEIDDYFDSTGHGQHTCATADAEAAYATYGGEVAVDGAAAQGCKQIDIALVADYTHVAALGGASASENEMLKRLNETDGIYLADLNYGFSVQELRTFSKSGGPAFNSKSTGSTPLEQFADYKKSQFAERGLAHLFVARSKSGTVGKAYIGSTCSTSKGAGVSNYLGKGKASTIVVAHEIGHNFGAKHDKADAPYIMAPSVSASVDEFSKASESKISSHVASASCFEPCGAEPEPEPDDDGSCKGACGGKSTDGCWCDSKCSDYGDCCEDKQQFCD